MFQFSEADTRIFEYSRGEWDEEKQQFKNVFADPMKIKRQLDIALPNRLQLIDQYLAGQRIASLKAQESEQYEKARAADPSLPEKTITYTEDETAIVRMGGIAHQSLCNGVRLAFNLLDFDEATGRGCNDFMVVAVWNHYNSWLEKKDGSTPPGATS